VRLLVWNIQQGGGPRRQRITEAIGAHGPDIVALIEFIPTVGGSLAESLRAAGFVHRICTKRNGRDYAVCVLSKTPISSRHSGIPALDDSGLWLEIAVPAHRFRLGVVHVPTKTQNKMKEFLSALVEVGSRYSNRSFLFAGDFNTGIGPADGPLKNFGDGDRFVALQENGFTDMWRHFHSDLIEFTYTWPRSGKSYRIDHALASRRLLPRIRDCRYSHLERDSRASDHSALLVEIED
jgi:exonuclease III